LDVFVAPTKPINPSFLPNAPEGGLTWPPTTATLISGRHDAVLVDALFTRGEAHDLGQWIAASGKRLTTIYITHGHSDHYFGLSTLREQFPTAKAVALPAVANAIDPGSTSLSSVARAKAMFGDQVPDHPVRPEPMDSPGIELEGHELVTMEMGRSDADISTILYVPSLKAVVAGDIAYNDAHVNVAATNPAERTDAKV
jgi:glyoxylase-like metal-dependent hydrolase (beta-lactamase superfamily II)